MEFGTVFISVTSDMTFLYYSLYDFTGMYKCTISQSNQTCVFFQQNSSISIVSIVLETVLTAFKVSACIPGIFFGSASVTSFPDIRYGNEVPRIRRLQRL
jgi:hypothetical protein